MNPPGVLPSNNDLPINRGGYSATPFINARYASGFGWMTEAQFNELVDATFAGQNFQGSNVRPNPLPFGWTAHTTNLPQYEFSHTTVCYWVGNPIYLDLPNHIVVRGRRIQLPRNVDLTNPDQMLSDLQNVLRDTYRQPGQIIQLIDIRDSMSQVNFARDFAHAAPAVQPLPTLEDVLHDFAIDHLIQNPGVRAAFIRRVVIGRLVIPGEPLPLTIGPLDLELNARIVAAAQQWVAQGRPTLRGLRESLLQREAEAEVVPGDAAADPFEFEGARPITRSGPVTPIDRFIEEMMGVR